jgi:UDP-N-acetylglucosamine diphosphorylase / glucose-1-phosphate thymidylyltransferase / UDP-N-acetylgalactosamine diphosphorylase / glucosamine-1-phosphate N-acetyltransferase / galactosamine-1-phosphate N-acetyltransferase
MLPFTGMVMDPISTPNDRKDEVMRVCLFEDHGALELEPLSLIRPVFELLCGLTSLAAKQSRFFPLGPRGVLVRPHLAELCRLHSPALPVNDLAWLRAGPIVLMNGRWLPPSIPLSLTEISGPCVALVNEDVAYAVVEPEHLADCSPDTLQDCLSSWKATLPQRPAGGRMIRYLWELVQHNGEQIVADWQTAGPPFKGDSIGSKHPGLAIIGPRDRVLIHPSARLDPMIVADTTQGPIVIDHHAVITAFTRLEGPCVLGPRTQVHGAKIRAGTTLGPDCRIGGEVEGSIVQGHSNKYHDGFLGHAYVGEWVNLGAGTQNSDLRNDYGEISVTVNGRRVNSGLTKVGCFLGDHTKAGLGTLLNTGTNAGIFCNLLPGRLLPKYIPSFASWWNETLTDRAELPTLLHTAAEVMRRRGVAITETHAALYRTLFEQTAAERRRAVRDAELRVLRRSA